MRVCSVHCAVVEEEEEEEVVVVAVTVLQGLDRRA